MYSYYSTGGEFNSEQKLNFSRPGRPPKRFLPPQFSSTPPLLSSSQVSTPTNTSKQVKPAYEGESNEVFWEFLINFRFFGRCFFFLDLNFLIVTVPPVSGRNDFS